MKKTENVLISGSSRAAAERQQDAHRQREGDCGHADDKGQQEPAQLVGTHRLQIDGQDAVDGAGDRAGEQEPPQDGAKHAYGETDGRAGHGGEKAEDQPCDNETGEDRRRDPEAAAPDQPEAQQGKDGGEPQHLPRQVAEQRRRQRHQQQHEGQVRSPGNLERVEAIEIEVPVVLDDRPAGARGAVAPGIGDDLLALLQRVGIPDRMGEPRIGRDHDIDHEGHAQHGQDAADPAREQVLVHPFPGAALGKRRLALGDHLAAEGACHVAHLSAPSAGWTGCRCSCRSRSAG